MENAQKDSQEIPPHLEQKKLIEFLESLHRIFKIGIYYPAGHKVLDQAAEHFQKNISGVADLNRSVRIEVKGESLIVEGHQIGMLSNTLTEFKKIIMDLGIGSIEIDRAILLPELLQFVRCLLLGRSQLQGIKQFTQAEITNLPSSVQILQKEFLIDESAILLDAIDEDSGHGLNTVFQILAEQGLDRGKIEQCKKFLNNLTEIYSCKPINIKGLPTVTWNDVRGLLVKVVTKAYNPSGNGAGELVQTELNTISAIFKGLQKELKDTESQETINLLVSVFGGGSFNKKKPVEVKKKVKEVRPAEKAPVQSIEQLQSFVDYNTVHRKALEKINQIDRREEMSILLQLLQWNQEPQVEGRIRQSLRDILTTQLNEREVVTLIQGVMHLATVMESDRFADIVHFLATVLHNGQNLSSQQFLLILCQKVSSAIRTLLWPLIVNDLLAAGRTADQKVFSGLAGIAADLSAGEMKERWRDLEKMDCFQEKRIAADIFDPALKNTFPLFSFLLDTTLKRQIGARILNNLAASPPDWLIEAVAPLLQLSNYQHMKFLQIYLLVAHQGQFSANTLVAAGTLIVHHLPEISEEQMGQPWVVKTIQATPEVQVEETRPLLQRITEEKRMFIVPKWPNDCRRAAAAALKQLKRRPLAVG